MPFLFLTKGAEKGWIGNTNGLSLKVSQIWYFFLPHEGSQGLPP